MPDQTPWLDRGFGDEASYDATYAGIPGGRGDPMYPQYWQNYFSNTNTAPIPAGTSPLNSGDNTTMSSANTSFDQYLTGNPMAAGAYGYAQAWLQQYGMESLTPFLHDLVQKQGVTDGNTLTQQLMAQPQFKQAFPEEAARQAAGLTYMSPGDILNYRAAVMQAGASVGIDRSFFTPERLMDLNVGNVSPAEVQNRLQNTITLIHNDPNIAPQLQNFYGQGMTPGEMAAYYLDPDHTEQYLTKQVAAAQIAGQGVRTGYGQIDRTQAEAIAGIPNMDAGKAATAFNQLGTEKELFGGLPGQNETNISQGQQLGAAFDQNAEDQRLITQRQRQRLASFSGGGGYTQPGQNGVPGGGGVAQ